MSVQKPTTLAEAMASYGLNSVERFPSFDPSLNEKRTGTTFYGDFKVAEAYSRNGDSRPSKRRGIASGRNGATTPLT